MIPNRQWKGEKLRQGEVPIDEDSKCVRGFDVLRAGLRLVPDVSPTESGPKRTSGVIGITGTSSSDVLRFVKEDTSQVRLHLSSRKEEKP